MLSQSTAQPFLLFLSFTILLLIQPNHAFFYMTCHRQGSSEYGNTDRAFTRFCSDRRVTSPACVCNSDGVVQCRGPTTPNDQRSSTSPENMKSSIIRRPDQVRCEQDCICQTLKPGRNMMNRLKQAFQPKKGAVLPPGAKAADPDEHEPFISSAEAGQSTRSCQARCTHFYDCDQVRAEERGCEDALCKAIYELSAGPFFGVGACISYSAYLLLSSGRNGKRDALVDELACPCNTSFVAQSCCWEPSGIVQGPGVWAVQLGQ